MIRPVPKPRKARAPKKRFSSIAKPSHSEMVKRSRAPQSPVRKKNAKRKSAEWLRAYGSTERIEFIHSLKCLVCGAPGCENAHIKTGGMGRKSDAKFIVPLCERDHKDLHVRGRRSWELYHNIDLGSAASRTEAEWQRFSGRVGGET